MSNPVTREDHSECTHVLRAKGEAYPRTCKVCGLTGPCRSLVGQALQSGKEGPTPATAPVFDVVSRAEHYNVHPSGIEAINIVRCLNFDMGCAVKYVMRRHGKEYARSLKSAAYYLKDQHQNGNAMMVNYSAFRLLETYAAAEPVAQAKAFYRAVVGYLNTPTEQHYQMVSNALTRLLEDEV